MKRLFVFLFSCILVCSSGFCQKKEIAQAQANIKSGKNLDKAVADMQKLLSDSDNTGNMKIWHTLVEALRIQYEQGNERLYLKQKSDTAALFFTARRLFLACEAMDSADARPDKKGRVKLNFRKRNAEYLNAYRKNLYSGGVYFISKQNYASAFDMFDVYLDCKRQPLFSGFKYGEDLRADLSAAYLATFCGAKLNNDSMTMKYSEKALLYEQGREKTLQYLAGIYSRKQEDTKYLETLKTGLEDYPKSEFFFTRTVDYYNSNNMPDSALLVADKALKADSLSTLFLYAKSNIMLNTGRYKECIALCDRVISLNDTIADTYYTAGVAYLNMAFEAEKNQSSSRKAEIKKYYKNAMPYMERYRELAPEQKDRWAAALYNIYLNLNMGKKFEEISKMLQ